MDQTNYKHDYGTTLRVLGLRDYIIDLAYKDFAYYKLYHESCLHVYEF